MTTLLSGQSLRQAILGQTVRRATATLPQTATQTIFNVNGGGVILTSFRGLVTSALGATVTTITVGVTPTVGSAQNAGLASATAVTSAAAGVTICLGSSVGGALVVGSAAGTPQLIGVPTGGLYVPQGAITITTSASDTGSVKWDLTYVPYEDGSSVSAA